jgi:DNA-binding NarL/FixJ family response regulator
MVTRIKVLIADDHKIFRDGIKALLEKEKSITITGEAESGDEVIASVQSNKPDVILMDINMGETNGIETTRIIKQKHSGIQVLILSMHGESTYIMKVLEAGATGYILKNAGKEELLTAINSVARGDSYFSREVSNSIIEQLHKPRTASRRKTEEIPLTDREIEVLKLIAQEYSNPEIAEELSISIRTVDTHRRNLLEKLQAKNTAGLVKFALRKGLIE